MLKFFYKVILVSFLSGSLANAQSTQSVPLFKPAASGPLSAEHSALVKRVTDEANAKAAKASAADLTTRTETLKTGVKSSSDIMATLTMTAVGTLASRLYKYKMTTDIMLAAAGGALFIAGEIVSFASLDSKLKEMETLITRDSVGNINSEQVKHLERLKQSYEEAIKTAGMKKNLQLAAAAAFAAAGIAAATMATADLAIVGTCNAGIVMGLGLLKTAAGLCTGTGPAVAACLAPLTTCAAGVTAYHTAMMSYELQTQAVAPSAPALATATSFGAATAAQLKTLPCTLNSFPAWVEVQNACTPVFPYKNIILTGAAGGAMANHIHPTLKKYFANSNTKAILKNLVEPSFLEKTLSLFIPQADAALFSAMGLLTSGAVTYVLATSASLAVELDFFMLNPKNRTYVWAGLAATTALATTATDNQVKQIKENIDKIDKILNDLNTNLANGTNTPNAPKPSIPSKSPVAPRPTPYSPTPIKYTDVKLSDTIKGDLSTPCYTGDDAKNCRSFESVIKDAGGYNNVDSLSQQDLGNVLKIADGVNAKSTITSGTLNGSATLGASANALRNSLSKLQKDAMEKLKKNGGTDDSALLNKRLSDGIEKSVNAGLAKSNSNAENMYASMYGGGGKSSSSNSSVDKKLLVDETKKDVNVGGGALKPGSFDLNTANSAGSSLGLGLDGKDFKDTAGTDLAVTTAEKGSSTMDDYDLKNDISKNSDTSIFELISNRYQKSGYPRLLRVKEPQSAPSKN